MQIISSQRYLDDDVVELKRACCDYTVTLSPVFEINGEEYKAVIDGHHSFAAAKIDGVAPDFVEATAQTDDRIELLAAGAIDDYLRLCWVDDNWHDINTGKAIF